MKSRIRTPFNVRMLLLQHIYDYVLRNLSQLPLNNSNTCQRIFIKFGSGEQTKFDPSSGQNRTILTDISHYNSHGFLYMYFQSNSTNKRASQQTKQEIYTEYDTSGATKEGQP
jgi:hypothetical protein